MTHSFNNKGQKIFYFKIHEEKVNDDLTVSTQLKNQIAKVAKRISKRYNVSTLANIEIGHNGMDFTFYRFVVRLTFDK